MDTNKKKLVTVTVDSFNYGMSLDAVKKFISNAEKEAHEQNITNLYFNIDYERDYGNAINVVVSIEGKRLETDAEFEKRIISEESAKRQRLAMYESLRKEFGDA